MINTLAACALLISLPQDFFNAPRSNGFDSFDTFAFASADFDGDGREDLLAYDVFDQIGEDVKLWRNNGNRQFELLAVVDLAPDFMPFISPVATRPGDFDGDGDVDLAVYFRKYSSPGVAAPNVRLFRNTGAGQFPSFEDFELPASADLALALAGDLEGDGTTELFVTGSTASWFRLVGGAFVQGPVLTLPTGLVLSSPELVDIDSDGLLDAVARGAPAYDTIQVVKSDAGGALVRSEIALPATIFNSINTASAVGDVDSDGDVDIVAIRRASGTDDQELILLPLIQAADGSFNAAAMQTFGQVANQNFIDITYASLVDLDEDGALDLISRPHRVFSGNGDGTFNDSIYIEFEQSGFPPTPQDIDADGHIDLIGATAIYYGDGTLERLTAGIDVDFATPPLDHRHLATDVDGDGDIDLFDRVEARLATNNSSGDFASYEGALPVAPDGLEWSSPIGFGDFDGDGFDDYVVDLLEPTIGGASNSLGLQLLAGRVNGVFEFVGTAAPSKLEVELPDSVLGLAFDANGDGRDDLAVPGGYHINVGDPQLLGLIPVDWGTPVQTFDHNGDGANALLTRESNEYVLHWFESGALQSAQYIPSADVEDLGRQLDLDGDGDLDLVLIILDAGSNPILPVDRVYIAENTGDGVDFAQLIELPIDGGFNFDDRVVDIAAGEINGDGSVDLVVLRDATESSLSSTRIEWFDRVGPGLAFELRAAWHARNMERIADVDGDGDLDVFGESSIETKRLEGLAFVGDAFGSKLQYGASVAGSGGIQPLIGTVGSLEAGSNAELRIVRGLGGAPALWGIGLQATEVPLAGFSGLTLLVDGLFYIQGVTLDGTPGMPGVGSYSLSYSVTSTLLGLTWFKQAFVVDAGAAALLSQTNGIEVRYGL